MENSLKNDNNFLSSKDSKETYTMRTKSDNINIIMGSKTDEIIGELFESLLQSYQGSEFVFYSVDLLYYELLK